MTDLATLRSLRERVIAATGADREIDTVVWLTLTPGVTRRKTHVPHWKRPYDIDETRDETGLLIVVPAYTASLDAAVALVERCLPDAVWKVMTDYGDLRRATVFRTCDGVGHSQEDAETPPLALLAALLSALIARAERGDAA